MERLEQELHNTGADGCGNRAVAATATNETPTLLTIGAYVGAVCAAVWLSLNLLHWFWRQLQ